LKKVRIFSLGCRLNQYEIQSVSTALENRNYQIIHGDNADIYIVNSCVVTSKSEAKTRNLINRAEKDDGPGSRIIVTGCFARNVKKEGNTVYLTNDYKYLIPEILENWDKIESLADLSPSRFHFTPPVNASTTRVNLKIQDGCDNYCTYCIIPFVRGNPVSRPFTEIENEFKTLLEAGYREIVLTGVNIGKYFWEGKGLDHLVEKLLSLSGAFRLHLSSIDPDRVSDNMISLLKNPKMVKHFHLSLQSGSNAVLKSMNRNYTREEYLDLTNRIKKQVPDFNFTTDVIVGFPGETDNDHEATLELIRETRFSHVHTFRYSPRPMTQAAAMKKQVAEKLKKERSAEIMKTAQDLKVAFYRKFEGREGIFLGEKKGKGFISGHNEYFLPVYLEGKHELNTFLPIKLRFSESQKNLSGEVIK
jgi:threonylcarbamoyladenosine tRNA methylthiotransferase MtaB